MGEEIADEMAKKLIAQNKDVFLDNDINGVDSDIKKEIEDLYNGLMKNLN